MSELWKDQPTPTCGNNTDLTDFCGVLTYVVYGAVARNLERRMRAAEALLEHTIDWSRVDPFTPLSVSIKAHLEAARKEDAQ